VRRIASILGLEQLLDRLPKELSGGQRQRVAMGRALVREPAVSLLDEPLSNLDAKLRSEVRAEIAELQRRTATTMIYVTHDQVEAMTLGHRVAVLDRGVLQQVAAPDELYDEPANVFVAGFIGNPPMNLIPLDGVSEGVATVRGSAARIDVRATATVTAGAELSDASMLGVRPEALALVDENGGSGFAATVEHVELLGHETLVHATIAGDGAGVRVTARVNGTHRLEPDTPIVLSADPRRIYLFDERSVRL
jgi:multiple sugar transport system ATP-binding protein